MMRLPFCSLSRGVVMPLYSRWWRVRRSTSVLAALLLVVGLPGKPAVFAQGLTGTLIGTVRDAQGGVLPDATVTITSTALIGGTKSTTTNDKGQLRFLALPPGRYAL